MVKYNLLAIAMILAFGGVRAQGREKQDPDNFVKVEHASGDGVNSPAWQWKNVDSDFGPLPGPMHVFRTNDSLKGRPEIAYYVSVPLKDRSLLFTSQVGYGKRLKPSEYYQQEQRPLLVVNTSFFSFKTNGNLNLVVKDGRMLAWNQPSRRHKGKDSAYYIYTTRSALGISRRRKADVAWIFTDPTQALPYAFEHGPVVAGGPDSIPTLEAMNNRHWRRWKMETAVGGGPVLVHDGKIRVTNEEEGLFIKGEKDIHPRSAIGYTRDGRIIVLAVQGRTPGLASGVTLAEEAKVLLDLGCYEALNLDGGGSSCLLVNGKETIHPSDKEGERPVPAVFIIKKIDLSELESRRVRLPNGWSLTPAGASLPLGDLPLNIAVSSSGRYAAVTNNGQSTQTIQLFDARADRQLDSIIIPKSWYGLSFSADETALYASGGNDNWILKYAIREGRLVIADTFKLGTPWPNKISPAGIAVDDKRGLLYAVTKENNSLYVVDMRGHMVRNVLPMSGEGYTCLLSPGGEELYCSVWGGDKVMVYNTGANSFTDSIAVGDNPNELCLTHTGRYLYVANANDNTVSVIDTRRRKVVETLNAALYPNAPGGSTTNGVSLSADEKTLYIANADNNCLAVFDVSRPGLGTSKGFIPTGWYATSVRVIGKKLYVANGKGFSSYPNPHGPNPYGQGQHVLLHQGDHQPVTKVQYIGGGLMMGALSIIPVPSAEQLAVYSRAVYHNTPYRKENELTASGEEGNPIPRKVGDVSPVKHVLYILKENRTYDQVLGDIPEGNGDTSLVLFGARITPNQHLLAREFVLLDNVYVDGEVSSDGHNWSMGAYATDFLEKGWPTSYGRRGGAEISSGYRKTGDNKGGYIWDQALRTGVTYRTYGEFADNGKANIPVLKGHFATGFSSMNAHIRDTMRVRQWAMDFDSLLAADALPRLMTMRLSNDHTEGTAAGRPTPFAHVADNDLAVGMLLDHLSHSPVWKETAVFIIEDDAQAGPDHVDAHRTTAYLAGGMVRRHFVDHTMYTTSSILRTLELILGMPPMTQFDAAATPMWRSFTSRPDLTPFTCLPALVDLNEVNPDKTKLSAMARGLDFSKEDLVPDAIMNAMLWKAVKGEDAVAPGPVRAAFFRGTAGGDKD